MSTLEKIKAELHATAEMHEDGDYYLRDKWVDEIIDKYAEQEPTGPCNLCNSCTNIGCEFQSGIVRTECAFYMPPHIETDNCGNYVVMPPVRPQEPKTGHWIEHPEIKTSTPKYLMFYECSECGDKQCFCKSDIHKKHFCNNCGARMVEPKESKE